MATTRMFRSCKPLGLGNVAASGSSSSYVFTVRCAAKTGGLGGEKMASGDHCDKQKSNTIAVKAAVAATNSFITLETQVDDAVDVDVDFASLLAVIRSYLVTLLRPAFIRKFSMFQVQLYIEKTIIDCRFFTLFAVMGSLLSSFLCFVEGSILIVESYIHYLNKLSPDEGQMVHLLIEAIDMFLLGTAMLMFGVGLYAIFVGSKNLKEKVPKLPESNLFSFFYLKSVPAWVELDSVSQAKSKIGHAVMMILQVGLLEKFKNVPLLTSLDLACFAGALLISSASIFLLSKLSSGGILGNSR